MKYAIGSPIRASLRLSTALSASAALLLTALPAFAGNETQPGASSVGPETQSSDTPQGAMDTTQSAATPKSLPLAEVLVRGSRLPTSLKTMPQSVQIVSSAQLAEQSAITTDVQTMLANTVPGLSQSSYSTGETLLSLRGRKPVILIDGVPVTSTLNDTGRELSMISSEDISEVEVIRGSSALYGQSEGAGFINFLTKGGEPGTANFRTEVGSGVSLTETSSDSLIPYVSQSAAGTANDFDYRADASFTTINSLYDANGDRLPPPVGAADQNSQTTSAFTKGGYNFGGDQRVEASYYYDKEESWHRYGEINGNILTGQPAVAIPQGGAPGEVPQLNDEQLLNLVYAKSSLFGSSTSLRAQTYYYKSFSIFQYTLDRFTLLPAGPDQNGQSENDTHKLGARADFNTTLDFLPFSGTLLWGVDWMRDRTVIPLVDGRSFGIPQTLKSVAGFVQLQFKPIDPLTLTVGVRREHDTLDISNFFSLFTLVNVTGGDLPYDATPVNAGFVYNLTPALDLFGGYSQGFNIQQTSQTFRSWPVSIDLATQKPPPNVVDSFEGGLRWHGNGLTASATYFYNKSSDAIAYSYNPAFPQDPSSSFTPDRVWGTEIESVYRWPDNLETGVSYAWMNGKEQTKGTWYPLQDRYIPPWTIDAHVQYDFAPDSYVRIQGLYSGSRDAFPAATPNTFYEGQYRSYFLTDISAKYDLSNIHGARIPGDITVSVSNAFNRLYFTAFSQGYNTNANYIRGPGAMLTIRYGVSY
ncbi:MAG TPA: TonB-dependent receptor [Steroidobacteraceae bacterium]|nr:TonB-dependent receptor [Steroidobacteraceae bacterium]